MVTEGIRLLKSDQKSKDAGFFLLAESGNIDSAHHLNLANRAIVEAAEFDKGIQAAINSLTPEELKETLIVVTADHGQTFTYGGWSKRGSQIYHESPGIRLMSYTMQKK